MYLTSYRHNQSWFVSKWCRGGSWNVMGSFVDNGVHFYNIWIALLIILIACSLMFPKLPVFISVQPGLAQVTLSNYLPITSSCMTWHKCASPVLSYSLHHRRFILFLATWVINSQSRGVTVMWCGHVVLKNRLWAPLMNHVLNLTA